ncbi:MAG TPA: hypothetical protein PLP17_13195 [Oligoflexia bacterium]|nr:hypothetical protein [Oligoflexia bacterium]
MAFENSSVNTLSVTRKLLGFDAASPQAKKWWKELELLNHDQPRLVVELADELLERNASIEDFFLACSHSGRDGVRENLRFLDLIDQDRRFAKKRGRTVRRVKRPDRVLHH